MTFLLAIFCVEKVGAGELSEVDYVCFTESKEKPYVFEFGSQYYVERGSEGGVKIRYMSDGLIFRERKVKWSSNRKETEAPILIDRVFEFNLSDKSAVLTYNDGGSERLSCKKMSPSMEWEEIFMDYARSAIKKYPDKDSLAGTNFHCIFHDNNEPGYNRTIGFEVLTQSGKIRGESKSDGDYVEGNGMVYYSKPVTVDEDYSLPFRYTLNDRSDYLDINKGYNISRVDLSLWSDFDRQKAVGQCEVVDISDLKKLWEEELNRLRDLEKSNNSRRKF